MFACQIGCIRGGSEEFDEMQCIAPTGRDKGRSMAYEVAQDRPFRIHVVAGSSLTSARLACSASGHDRSEFV